MTISKSAKISNALTVVLLILTTLQGFISSPPFTPDEVNLYSPILLLAVIVIGYVKNIFAPDVNPDAKWPIIIVAIIGILGAVNDHLWTVVNFSEGVEQKLRLALTAIAAVLTALSKTMFPTPLSLTSKDYQP